ncbi:MAG: cysteine desulfurase [Candidatus Dependentiae bacterium]|nr:cysteine desulfurase [Candidatus Dependentiae bacterium]
MPKNDLKSLRAQFPIFKQKVNGYPFIYFDSASTAQMPQCVVDRIVSYYTTYKANVGRGVYTFAEKATTAYEASRDKIAQFIGASSKEIIFTSGATEGINLVASSWAENNLQQGDEILVSAVEHHSNFLPWQQLALRKSLVLTIMPVDSQGVVDVEVFKKHLSKKTKLVAIVHSSNLFGSSNDVAAITKLAHAVGAKVLIDASQSVAHQRLDIAKIGCDFLAFSGHKLFGPTGVGVLFVKESMIPEMTVSTFGGGMVFSVEEKNSTFKQFPYNFEAGTPNIAQVIGLGAAVDFVENNIDFAELAEHETMLTKMLIDGLRHMDDIVIVSSVGNEHGHLVTFYSKIHHAHDIAAYLDQFGIAVRAGHHCVQLFHQACGINASVRVSFSMYNTKEEVEFLLQCLRKIIG